MVDSTKITNLHVPSDVIVDASMPAMIRTSGQMYNIVGDQQDTIALIRTVLILGLRGYHWILQRHGALTQEQWEVFQM
jgi:monomeric isocitrate dehydrogenase